MSVPARFREQISDETQFLRLDYAFELESGEQIDELVIAYRTWGQIENARDHAILICHALTGSADVDAWWPDVVGTNKAFDPASDFVVCANILGSCYGTTGPVSAPRGSTQAYRADFPAITVRDMVNVEAALLDYLGVERLELVTGPSLGGMQALEWAAMYPERVGSVIPIGVGGRHSAWCIGISEAQRAAIATDPNWKGGYYQDDAPPEQGLAAARMMAVCTYRSWLSFDERFGRKRCPDSDDYEVQSYLKHQGRKINQRFDANTYVTLTHAMHTHDLARGRGRYEDIVGAIKQPVLVVSVSTDSLYPPAEQQALAELLPNATYKVLDSAHGHDGFLIETGALGRLIATFRHNAVRPRNLRLVSSAAEQPRC